MTNPAEDAARRNNGRDKGLWEALPSPVLAPSREAETSASEGATQFALFSRDPARFGALFRFSPHEFTELFVLVEENLRAGRTARGVRPKFGPKDGLLALVYFLAQYPTMEQAAVLFGTTPQVFLGTVERTLALVREPLVGKLIVPIPKGRQWGMGMGFAAFPQVALVIDYLVTPILKPAQDGSRDVGRFWSAKDGIYCVKRGYGTAPDGRLLFVSRAVPGGAHDLSIFRAMAPTYAAFLKKTPEETSLVSGDPEPSWALIGDRGHVGASQHVRAIVPTRDNMIEGEAGTREDVGPPRIVVGNFFGRMKRLFRLMVDTYRGDVSKYDSYADACAALTNFHIRFHGLGTKDHHLHHQLLAMLAEKGEPLAAETQNDKLSTRGKIMAGVGSSGTPQRAGQ